MKIVPEENLDSEKAALSVVTSCHLYSIQKTKIYVSVRDYPHGTNAILAARFAT